MMNSLVKSLYAREELGPNSAPSSISECTTTVVRGRDPRGKEKKKIKQNFLL